MLKTIVDDTSAAVEKLTKNQIQSQILREEIPALEVWLQCWLEWFMDYLVPFISDSKRCNSSANHH